METFDSYELYLEAMPDRPELAILPIGVASEIFSRQDRTIKAWIMDGRLNGIRIGASIYPLANSISAKIKHEKNEVKKLYNRLIDHVVNNDGVLYYSVIMDEFGYSHRNHAEMLRFGFLLGDASRESRKEMLEDGMEEGYFISSCVWRKPAAGKLPSEIGEGFWGLVESELGEVIPTGKKEKFVRKHMKKCQKYFRNRIVR